jgi:hypothetical protein
MPRRTLGRLVRTLATWAAPTCSHAPAAPPAPSGAAPDFPADYYDPAPGTSTVLREETEGRTRASERHRIHLGPLVPAALASVPGAVDPIEVIHYRPDTAAGDRRPLVLMSPILGNSLLLIDRFAKALSASGIHAAVVLRKDLTFHPEHSIRIAEEETRLVVMRSRQVLDYLVARADVDPDRLGTFGISAGGIVSSMVAGADPRLRTHMWLLAGGPLPDVLIDTVEDEFRGYAREILRTSPRTRGDLRRELRSIMRTDPIQLAPRIDRERVLMVLARFDRSVPYRHGLALWHALGKPERITSPFGHYSTFLLLPWLEERTLAHFGRHFCT